MGRACHLLGLDANPLLTAQMLGIEEQALLDFGAGLSQHPGVWGQISFPFWKKKDARC